MLFSKEDECSFLFLVSWSDPEMGGPTFTIQIRSDEAVGSTLNGWKDMLMCIVNTIKIPLLGQATPP